jgi:lipid A 3-O-deacylase
MVTNFCGFPNSFLRFFLVLTPLGLYSQVKDPILVQRKLHFFQQEISVVSDNDNYTLQMRDGYYTNGLYLQLSYAADINKHKRLDRKAGIQKIVNGFRIGQAIYNPESYSHTFPEQQDRPFAGYCSITFEQRTFFKNSTMLKWATGIGVTGPLSFAENVQRWYHNLINIYDVKGWPYQLRNEFNLNVSAAYYKLLLNKSPQKHGLKFSGYIKTNIGNANTDISIGSILQLGKTDSYWNSSHLNGRLSIKNDLLPGFKNELYFFYEPELTIQGYKSWLQGGLFLKYKGPVCAKLNPVVLSQQLGIRYAEKRFTAALIYIHKTKEAKKQFRNEEYCSMQIGYKFKGYRIK